MLLERRIPEEANAWSNAQDRLTSGRCAARENGESEATSQNAGSREPDGGLARDLMDQGSSACLPPPKANVPSHATRRCQDSTETPTLNFSQFVVRQYWRKRWATRYRFRVHSVANGAFSSGVSQSLWVNCNHLQIVIN